MKVYIVWDQDKDRLDSLSFSKQDATYRRDLLNSYPYSKNHVRAIVEVRDLMEVKDEDKISISI